MKQIKENKVVIIIVLASIIFAHLFHVYGKKEYERYETGTLHYVKAVVKEIIKEEIQWDDELKINYGEQELLATIQEGEQKGEDVKIKHTITPVQNIQVKKGTNIIVNADTPEGIEPYYTIYNYDRTIGICGSILLLLIFIVAIGRGKGVKSIAGLVYSLYIIAAILLPTIFSGYSPVLMSIIVCILSTLVSLLLLNGETAKTYGAIISTVAGVLLSSVLFFIVSAIVHINGFNSEEIEALILIGQSTGLRIKEVLFAGILVSSLGAIMDVGMSILSALYELHYHKPEITGKELFTSGIEIGKDMIGTMCNTLILAFTGSALVTLLAFYSYSLQFNQLLNSNYLTIEIVQGICGTFGIVLTVPIASAVGAFLFGNKNQDLVS